MPRGGARAGAGCKPLHQPTPDTRRQVEECAGLGIPVEQIAKLQGMSRNTLLKFYRKELDLGHIKANAKIAQTLFRQATGGNTAALIFWSKCRSGWRESPQSIELTGKGGASLSVEIIHRYVNQNPDRGSGPPPEAAAGS